MAIQLAALDLDGTLLHEDMTISDYSRRIIRQAAETIRIVIATGRMFDSARAKVQPLGLGDVPIICYTGAWIGLAESGTVLHEEGIPLETALAILADSRRYQWTLQSYAEDEIYLPEPLSPDREARLRRYRSKGIIPLGEVFYHPVQAPTRFVIVEESPRKRQAIRDYLEAQYGDVVEMVHPGDMFLNVQKKGVTKGSALCRLGREWHIAPEEMVSFGNTENDASMLALTGWSYAVANAEPEAKGAAKAVLTRTNDEDGPARQLAALLGLEE